MSNDRMQLLNEELRRIVNIIIEEYKPEKIILFGSLVNGTVHEFSDIDSIVIKDSDKPFFSRLEEIILLTMPKVGADILVYTPDEFEKIKDRLFIQEEIMSKERVLYSAH